MASWIVSEQAADDEWGVTSIESDRGDSGPSFRKTPCGDLPHEEHPCPWRRDAPVGTFPDKAFQISAHTTYDMADATFACHNAGVANPVTCAGFLLRGAFDNLSVRMWHTDLSAVHSDHALYDSYREMAIANGVDPEDPAIAPCRGDRGEWIRPRNNEEK